MRVYSSIEDDDNWKNRGNNNSKKKRMRETNKLKLQRLSHDAASKYDTYRKRI